MDDVLRILSVDTLKIVVLFTYLYYDGNMILFLNSRLIKLVSLDPKMYKTITFLQPA